MLMNFFTLSSPVSRGQMRSSRLNATIGQSIAIIIGRWLELKLKVDAGIQSCALQDNLT